jgi:hypothetical protein
MLAALNPVGTVVFLGVLAPVSFVAFALLDRAARPVTQSILLRVYWGSVLATLPVYYLIPSEANIPSGIAVAVAIAIWAIVHYRASRPWATVLVALVGALTFPTAVVVAYAMCCGSD